MTNLTGNSGEMNSILSVISLIFIFVLIVALAYFTTRFIAKHQNNMLNNKSNIRIVESFRIGTNKFIAIVKIGEAFYAIGVGKDEVTMIDKLNPDDLTDFNAIAGESDGVKMDFKEILAQIKNKNSKNNNSKDNNDTK